MKQAEYVYDIAGFPIGTDLEDRDHLIYSNKKPLVTCFYVPDKENFYLQKLFSSYAIFARNSPDIVRKMFSLISHIESDRTLLHGGLTVRENKNLLFLGNRAAGKSTLTISLGDPIDDDTLVYNPGNGLLYVPSVNGFTAQGRSPNKKMEVASTNPEPKKPDAIFLLDKSKKGGYIQEIDTLPLEFYLPNYFKKENTQQYIKHNNFSKPKNVPVYLLGTNGRLEKTIEAVEKII